MVATIRHDLPVANSPPTRRRRFSRVLFRQSSPISYWQYATLINRQLCPPVVSAWLPELDIWASLITCRTGEHTETTTIDFNCNGTVPDGSSESRFFVRSRSSSLIRLSIWLWFVFDSTLNSALDSSTVEIPVLDWKINLNIRVGATMAISVDRPYSICRLAKNCSHKLDPFHAVWLWISFT